MLDKPDLEDARLTSLLRDVYGLTARDLTFLPLGADPNTAVYKAVTPDATAYFVKLRRGLFDELSVRLPRYLSEHGVPHLIPVIETTSGDLWAGLEPYTVVVYPFVEGRDGYERPLSRKDWQAFGVALRRLHTLELPPDLRSRLRRETYDGSAREQVRAFLLDLDAEPADRVARQLFSLMREHRAEVADLINRAEGCAAVLQARAPALAVCHADLHAGNVLIGENGFYLVDWDDPILAPKERDLMFVGGAQGFVGTTPDEEERLFHSGYGSVNIDPVALSYYRLERIVQDVAAFCDEIIRGPGSEAERERSLRYLASNFTAGGTLERAYAVATEPGV